MEVFSNGQMNQDAVMELFKTHSAAIFDMDGTLLNSDKEIAEDSIEAIHRAVTAGKYVTLSTGRPVPEIAPYDNALSEVPSFSLTTPGLATSPLTYTTISPEGASTDGTGKADSSSLAAVSSTLKLYRAPPAAASTSNTRTTIDFLNMGIKKPPLHNTQVDIFCKRRIFPL